MPRAQANVNKSVFLNIPYDHQFQRLCVAYIAGICAFGLVPRATLEIPGGQVRLSRILQLIQQCRYSIHDLSRVQLDLYPPRCPRFNMPFELGLTVGHCWNRRLRHTWFAFESMRYRQQKSLSDINGTDVYVHEGRVSGVFRELRNAFLRRFRQPTVQDMQAIYRDLWGNLDAIKRAAGADSLYDASVFIGLVTRATAVASKMGL